LYRRDLNEKTLAAGNGR